MNPATDTNFRCRAFGVTHAIAPGRAHMMAGKPAALRDTMAAIIRIAADEGAVTLADWLAPSFKAEA